MKSPALAADPPASQLAPAPLVHVLRGGRLESIHCGHVAVVDAGGRLLAWAGDPASMVFARSTFKPFQALPVVESRAFEASGLGAEALAVMAGSHGGTDRHVDLVRSILAAAGADEAALGCGAHPPYDEPTAAALRARGEAPSALRNNCSGKHAGMLLLARALGAPLEGYLDPDHPVQRLIVERFEQVLGTRLPDPEPAIDGCGAPAPRLPLALLARAFALLALGWDAAGRPVAALEAIRDAMRAHPEDVAGAGRLDTRLMRVLGGAVISKAGAEATHAAGHLERGLGVAVKVVDGTRRSLGPAVIGALEAAGLLGAAERAALAPEGGSALRNHAGRTVGAIEGVVRLERPRT